jgi:dTDP-glucose 4,6-dehydratase
MKILVTGGAGFIGSNFIRYWLQEHGEDEVVSLDKLTYAGHLSSTKDFQDNKSYKFIEGDICNSMLVNELMKDIDVVVHFAAESHVDRSIINPEEFVKTNVLGTHVLLDAAIHNKIKRFHHVSTDEVFGALPLDSDKKFDENTCYDPHSPYSASKAGSDHLVRAYHDTYGLNTTVTNCANNFGPYHDPEKFFPRMITNLIDGKKIPIYGDGKYVRDWLYVEDHCRAIDLVIQKGKAGDTYLVGSMTQDVNNLEIAKKLLEIFNLDESYLEFVKDRPGHDRRYAIDWSKINKELGWEPKHDFDTWLQKTVDWYKENEWWWRPLKAAAEKFYNKST